MKTITEIPKRFGKNSDNRKVAVMHAGAQIMLNVWDMADTAGLTEDELLVILSEQVHRAVVRSVRGKKK